MSATKCIISVVSCVLVFSMASGAFFDWLRAFKYTWCNFFVGYGDIQVFGSIFSGVSEVWTIDVVHTLCQSVCCCAYSQGESVFLFQHLEVLH